MSSPVKSTAAEKKPEAGTKRQASDNRAWFGMKPKKEKGLDAVREKVDSVVGKMESPKDPEAEAAAEERRQVRYHSLDTLYRKELADHISSKRLVIILVIVAALSIASVYGALTGIKSAMDAAASGKGDSFDTTFMFLKLYTTSGNSIPSYMSLIALIGPFIGLILGFDAINSEKSNGTLNRLVSQPIYRDSIIVGKFLASATLITVMVFATGIAVGAAGFLFSGIKPDGEQIARVLIYLIYTIVYICFWLAMSMLFSVFTRHAATSALASIALWLFFAIFMSLLAGIIADGVYPVSTEYQQAVNALKNANLNTGLNRISPYYLYSEAASIIMNPAARAINAVSYAQLVGAISGYLSLGQSLLLVWPHLVGLLALTFVSFEISYVGFMRQEIRGN